MRKVGKTPRQSFRCDPELWQAFLAKAEERGETGTDALLRFMRSYVRRTKLTTASEEAETGALAKAAQLLAELADPDECWFDHRGGCQAHGFLDLEPGKVCPNAEARAFISQLRSADITLDPRS